MRWKFPSVVVALLTAILAIPDPAQACWTCKYDLGIPYCDTSATGGVSCTMSGDGRVIRCRENGICADGCWFGGGGYCPASEGPTASTDSVTRQAIPMTDALAARIDSKPPELKSLLRTLVTERGIEGGTYRGRMSVLGPNGKATRSIEFNGAVAIDEWGAFFEIEVSSGSPIQKVAGWVSRTASAGEVFVTRRGTDKPIRNAL